MTSAPDWQPEYRLQPLASSAEGVPVHPSISAHFWNVPCAPRKVTGIPATTEDGPPAYGTNVSARPRNEITVIARGGVQVATFSCSKSKAAGATAAKTSPARQAR